MRQVPVIGKAYDGLIKPCLMRWQEHGTLCGAASAMCVALVAVLVSVLTLLTGIFGELRDPTTDRHSTHHH